LSDFRVEGQKRTFTIVGDQNRLFPSTKARSGPVERPPGPSDSRRGAPTATSSTSPRFLRSRTLPPARPRPTVAVIARAFLCRAVRPVHSREASSRGDRRIESRPQRSRRPWKCEYSLAPSFHCPAAPLSLRIYLSLGSDLTASSQGGVGAGEGAHRGRIPRAGAPQRRPGPQHHRPLLRRRPPPPRQPPRRLLGLGERSSAAIPLVPEATACCSCSSPCVPCTDARRGRMSK
jgi:hypothetical protein